MNRTLRSFAILFFVASSRLAAGQVESPAYSANLQSASRLAEEKRVEEAVAKYAKAAQVAPSERDKVEVWLAWAGLLSRNLGEEGEGTTARRAAQAEEMYRSAISEAEGDLRLRAHNDFGVFLLRRGQAGQASTVLGKISGAPWPGEDGPTLRARYLYNWGQALELSRHEDEAYPRYLEAMRLDPQFVQPRKAALRLASLPATTSRSAGPPLLLVKELLDQKHLAEAESSLRLVADNPGRLGAGDRELFADLLLRYLTDAAVEPGEFTRTWKGSVESLSEGLPAPAGDRLRDIRDAYLAELPVEFPSSGEAGPRFRAWSDAGRVRPFSDFLKMVGDAYATRGELRRSLERYSQAVRLDPTNSTARLYLTNLLVSYSGQLDPEGNLLDRWQTAGVESETARDPQELKNYVHLHSLLGEHFEKENPRVALAHLRRAVDIEERIADIGPSPVLRQRLGAAYETLGEMDLAAREYRAAQADHRSPSNDEKARDLLNYSEEVRVASADTDTSGMTGTYEEDQGDFLPDTASLWPLIGIGALVCLAAALGIRALLRRSRSVGLPS